MTEDEDNCEIPCKKSRRSSSTSLEDLSDVPALHIASFLHGKDLFNFSHSCRRIFNICNNDGAFWRRLLLEDDLLPCHPITQAAETLLESGTTFATSNIDKLIYFMQKRTRQNWFKGSFSKAAVFHPGNVVEQTLHEPEMIASLHAHGRGNVSAGCALHTFDVKTGTYKINILVAPVAAQMLKQARRIQNLAQCFIVGKYIILFFNPEHPDSSIHNLVAVEMTERGSISLVKDRWLTAVALESEFSWFADSKTFYIFTLQQENLQIQGISIETGLQQLMYTIQNVTRLPGPVASDKDKWLVFSYNTDESVFALNVNDNSRVILDLPTKSVMAFVKDLECTGGMVMGLDSLGYVAIWKLPSGEVLYRVERYQNNYFKSNIHLKIVFFEASCDFIQFAVDTPFIWMRKKPGARKFEKIVENDGFSSRNFELNVNGSKMILNHFLEFDLDHDWKCGITKLRNYEITARVIPFNSTSSPGKSWDVLKVKRKKNEKLDVFVYPTCLAIKTATALQVLDFLRLEDYKK